MVNSGFRNFTINKKASTKRPNNKGLTMPTKEDFARMEAHRKIEQRREMEELERSFDLNYY